MHFILILLTWKYQPMICQSFSHLLVTICHELGLSCQCNIWTHNYKEICLHIYNISSSDQYYKYLPAHFVMFTHISNFTVRNICKMLNIHCTANKHYGQNICLHRQCWKTGTCHTASWQHIYGAYWYIMKHIFIWNHNCISVSKVFFKCSVSTN